MSRYLLLIRHSQSQPRTGVRPEEFLLTDEGRRRCKALADQLAAWKPAVILTSEEPKAAETGRIVARMLGLDCHPHPGLEEHHRGIVEALGSQEQFEQAVEQIFDVPEEVVYGLESGAAALARFSAAVESALIDFPGGNIALASHGTVMSLFVAAHNELDVKAFWRNLKMPDLVVLSLSGYKLLQKP